MRLTSAQWRAYIRHCSGEEAFEKRMEQKEPTAAPRFINFFYFRWFHATDVAKSDGTPFKYKGSKSQAANKSLPSHWYLS